MKHWKSKLAAAGFSALAGSGLILSNSAQAAGTSSDPVYEPSRDLASAAQWKHLSATWREASLVASGTRGDYPFTAEEKKKLLADLEQVGKDIAALSRADLLTETEAALLAKDLPRLVNDVNHFRPKEMMMATCYEPMAIQPTAAANLAERLPLLEKLAAQKKLQPQVLSKVLANAERDLSQLKDPKYLAQYRNPEERAKAEKVRDEAAKQIDKIRLRLVPQSVNLEESPQWKKITEAWKIAAPMAFSSQFATRQRDEAKRALEDAVDAADGLAERGLLAPAEAALLANDAQTVIHAMYYSPPADNTVVCYGAPLPFYYPRGSLERISKQLPLLQKLVESGRVNRAVIEKVLPHVERDLQTLSGDEQIKQLEGVDQFRARQILKTAPEELARIKKLLENSK